MGADPALPYPEEGATDVCHLRPDMGKLRPAGHIRPVRLFNPARRTCPNYSKNLLFFPFPCNAHVSPIDGALKTH